MPAGFFGKPEHFFFSSVKDTPALGVCPAAKVLAGPSQVSDQDVTVDGLVQSGFKMPYALSHEDLTVHIEPLSGPPLAPKVFELRKKDKALCLPRAGEYTITPQSCLRFENDIYQFNTDAPNILEFFSTGFEVQGTIVVANMPEAAVKVDPL